MIEPGWIKWFAYACSKIWLNVLIYSYTKPKGQLPDYTSPVVLPDGRTVVEDFCLKIHKNLIKEFK